MNKKNLEACRKALMVFFGEEHAKLDKYTKEELYNNLYVFMFAYHESVRTGKPYIIPGYKMTADYYEILLNDDDVDNYIISS